TVYINPVLPLLARKFMLGVVAASKGVLFPSSGIGKSPIPSLAMYISFNAGVFSFNAKWLNSAHKLYFFFALPRIFLVSIEPIYVVS
ncbi:MAG: hypothetical protein NWE80_04455, partial [Candidatus Bathyarchaeota archaeon]|nr:hypothetical protein [Candidatus Bathyarchaeota archaeon]